MNRRFALPLILFASCSVLLAQKAEQENKVPTPADLLAVTVRGKMLAEYDIASWHATDAVQDLKPEKGSTRWYIAKKAEGGWVVVFGRLSDAHDKFLTVYQATQGTRPEFFTVKKYDPPLASTDFYLCAAKAFESALKDLGPVNRPYNAYAIPSADMCSMVQKRQMHKSILEFAVKKNTVAGYHAHVLSLTPEDSDVFYVLTRKPSIPEYVGTLDRKIYVIQTDGTILLGK
jgi:hypothetical protein